MKASNEFKVGKHNIGYIESRFSHQFKSSSFEKKEMPTFQKLPRSMNDAAIEFELKPGLCELGDIIAFLDNAPEECKDGYWNLFYMEPFVVSVSWDSVSQGWLVSSWDRLGNTWHEGSRVFAPATESSNPSYLEHSEPLILKNFAEQLEEVLDEQFPKGKCKERGSALMLFAHAVRLHKDLKS